MFIASKILALLTQPLWWVVALLVSACLILPRKPVLGRRIAAAALTILLVLGWQPIPEWAIRELESSYTEFFPHKPT